MCLLGQHSFVICKKKYQIIMCLLGQHSFVICKKKFQIFLHLTI
uniref:Uncharacterized protein n=1 Tax=Arundo donax TaxID=35708 RepID=A0A0A9H2Y4_ARUDO